jgi:hypothetical protein
VPAVSLTPTPLPSDSLICLPAGNPLSLGGTTALIVIIFLLLAFGYWGHVSQWEVRVVGGGCSQRLCLLPTLNAPVHTRSCDSDSCDYLIPRADVLL